ncbi:hypothetical protein [Clostridium sp. AF28-12]|uniref:hypothetical protein n=1 Tax=Clostridium sp. AF28-12 TaxID=2305241 RepID=UPI0011C10A5F|nr:hypothetical protein [Clostridium sp. AF28-12]
MERNGLQKCTVLGYKNGIKRVTKMERNGLQKCTVLGYKNGIKRVTKMEWIGLQEFQKPLSAK